MLRFSQSSNLEVASSMRVAASDKIFASCCSMALPPLTPCTAWIWSQRSDLGYELFRDRDSMRATFITADLTKPSIPSTEPFVSGVDIISAHSLFHLFNLEEQKIVAKHLVRLTKPNAGSMIFGLHIGTLEAVERHAIFDDAVVFFHNVESFDRFWQDVGTATDSRWRVDARAEQIPEMGRSQAWCMPDTTLFVFTVRRM